MIDLPNIEMKTVNVLAGVFDESELLDSIAYLELVYTGRVIPGPELNRLGISPLEYTDQELWAVQNRCALAIQKIQITRHTNKPSRGRGDESLMEGVRGQSLTKTPALKPVAYHRRTG